MIVANSMRRKRSLATLAALDAARDITVVGSPAGTPIFRASSSAHGHHLEGKRLSRRSIEAARRAAKEALEEDVRALDLVGSVADGTGGDDYASMYSQRTATEPG